MTPTNPTPATGACVPVPSCTGTATPSRWPVLRVRFTITGSYDLDLGHLPGLAGASGQTLQEAARSSVARLLVDFTGLDDVLTGLPHLTAHADGEAVGEAVGETVTASTGPAVPDTTPARRQPDAGPPSHADRATGPLGARPRAARP